MRLCSTRVFNHAQWRALRGQQATAALGLLLLLLLSGGCGAVRSVWPGQTDNNEAHALLHQYYQCAATYGHDRVQLQARCEPYVTALKNWRAAQGEPARTTPQGSK